MPVKDRDGRPADLRVWNKHWGQPEWRIGSTYELEGVKQNPLKAKKARYETATNSRIARLGRPTAPDVSLLHVSDTHLGRPLTDKERMGDGNQLGRYLDVVNLAVTHRVDAVLHTGDIFDDNVDEATAATVEEHVKLLADAGIPLYYVRGNHGCDAGDRLLREQTREGQMAHLSSEPELLGGGALALYGLDASASTEGLPQAAPTGDAPRDAYRLVAWHEAVEPLARNGVPIQRLVDASEVEFDGLALGDLHKDKRAYIDDVRRECGRRLRVFYAGATTQIARNADGYEPAVWLLQVSDGRLERRRLPLRPTSQG
ncbi:exonuclease SbcCD subunit D [Natrialbaceae archaeon GCM10025896]